jgi:hypothetical protein
MDRASSDEDLIPTAFPGYHECPVNEMPAAAPSQLLQRLKERLLALALPRGLAPSREALEAMLGVLENLERRLAEGPGAPLRIAFFGPTGAGKSKLLSSLLGANVSPSGFRRPYTLRPAYSVHERHGALRSRLEGDVQLRSGADWRDAILIDSPDFDSVERRNRAEADRIFAEAEALVFVTDVQKYADQSTWDYLGRMDAVGKPAVLVLNKAVGEGAADDFRRRLEARGARAALIVIPELSIDDQALLPASEPGLGRLRRAIETLAGGEGERSATLRAAWRGDIEGLLRCWESLSAPLGAHLAALAALGKELAAAMAKAGDSLEANLEARLDPGLRAELQSRLLERIQKIDILRYPRQLLALPFSGLRKLLGDWWPFSRRGAEPDAATAAQDPVCQRLESEVLALMEAFVAATRREPSLAAEFSREEIEALRSRHEEIAALFAARDREYRDWLRREAETTASKLTGENKLKFILSQVIYNAVVVGVQIHTAGHFTLVELATDGVLSPLVAKAVGLAVSSERVGQFERQARAERARLLRGIIDEAGARLRRAIELRLEPCSAFEAAAAELEAIRANREALTAAFDAARERSTEHVGS